MLSLQPQSKRIFLVRRLAANSLWPLTPLYSGSQSTPPVLPPSQYSRIKESSRPDEPMVFICTGHRNTEH